MTTSSNPTHTGPNAATSTVTSTVTATTPARSSSQTGPGVLVTAVLSGAFLAAGLTALINTWLARRKSREEERSRVRTTCAEAFEAVTAYKEFPYAIRRRQPSKAVEERIRLSEELRHIQSRLSYFTAWMKGESEALGAAYSDLISNLRLVAGTACRDAWLQRGVDRDEDMNIPSSVIDLSGLKPYEEAYIHAVRTHLDHVFKIKRRH